MIRRVSVLDVEGSDFSPAVPFLGPCKFYTVFVNLGLFAINAIILHVQTAHFLFSGHRFYSGTEGNMFFKALEMV